MKRYVVTGGAGFIGSALVRGLLAKGDGKVAVIDNLLTGKLENLDEVKNQIEFHQTSICDFDAMAPVIAGADTVFHMAAIPSVPRSITDPDPSHQVNVNGTWNVLQAARQGNARRVVYAASSSAYGDTDVLPKVETMATRPKSPYAVQKLLGEQYASVFTSCFGLETVSLRFFNVYGPRQDPSSQYSGVLSVFMKSLLSGTRPPIHGDGEQTRDFTYVGDVVALVIKAANTPAETCGRVFNAGNGGRFSLNYVWNTLQKIEGVRLEPKYGPNRAGDVRDSQADTNLATTLLGHVPRYSLEEGLRETLEWYRVNVAKLIPA